MEKLEEVIETCLKQFNFSVPIRFEVKKTSCNGTHNSIVSKKYSRITIHPKLSHPKPTIYHEIGHHIYIFELTSIEKQVWDELYAEGIKYSKHGDDWKFYFVSKPAMNHEHEDFACTFSAWHYERDAISPKKRGFVSNVVGRLKQCAAD